MAGFVQQLGRRHLEGLAEAQPRAVRALHQRAEQRAPLLQRHGAQVVPRVVRQVEHEELQLLHRCAIEGVLQGIEVGHTVLVEQHDLAVEPRRAELQGGHIFGQALELRGPVVAVAREQAGLRFRLGQNAVRLRFDHAVFIAGTRMLVALLDQQPRLLFLALTPMHAHQRPAAFELVAVQAKLQVPLAQALARIALGLPLAAVPYDHLAGAVLPRRDRALEAGVVQRVVFHMHRHALVGGVEARPLGHGPALQRAVELEAEVVVQAARMVLLHDEVQCAALLGGAPLRLGRGAEIAPFPIAVQRLSAHG